MKYRVHVPGTSPDLIVEAAGVNVTEGVLLFVDPDEDGNPSLVRGFSRDGWLSAERVVDAV